jgi:hypothetical protein
MEPFHGMKQGLPFTPQNRPWLSPDCIEAMNEQFMICLSHIPEHARESLRDWAAAKVEFGYCHDRPDIIEHCIEEWGREKGAPLAASLKFWDMEQQRYYED